MAEKENDLVGLESPPDFLEQFLNEAVEGACSEQDALDVGKMPPDLFVVRRGDDHFLELSS